MADQKYYTPDIEEFHVGFEYEIKHYSVKDKWHKLILDESGMKTNDCGAPGEPFVAVNDWDIITTALEEGKLRVKHLDREDIESLGWKSKDNGFYEKDDFQILITEEPYNIQIFHKIRYLGSEKEERIFWGVLKNISELKKLMKQLNIE